MTGWQTLVEMFRLAVENARYRRQEAREANLWHQFIDLGIR